jgi:hypothetical protein
VARVIQRSKVDSLHLRGDRNVILIRSLAPSRAALRTRILLAPVLVAIACQARNVDVAIGPTATDRPELTAQDAKIALVEMFRRYAVRDPKRCRDVWGSPEPDRQLARVLIQTNSNRTSQIGIFSVRLDKQDYFFWGGSDLYEGSFRWEQAGWRASEYRMTGHGCLMGRESGK